MRIAAGLPSSSHTHGLGHVTLFCAAGATGSFNAPQSGGGNWSTGGATFSSSDIYGKSNTVTPKSCEVGFFVKY